ncbi:MAG: hypothetical protein SVK08_13680 [Halobacteriota archaeon]|nr:hypothetical protein [Halobacteriota archaeon]
MKELKLEVKKLEKRDMKQSTPIPSPSPTASEQTYNLICDVGENIFDLCGGLGGT